MPEGIEMTCNKTSMRVVAALATLFFAPVFAEEPAADRPAYRGSPTAAGGKCCQTLGEVRQNIDRIDHEIVRLMAERGQYVSEAARFKPDPTQVEAPQRAEAVVQKAKHLAEEDGLPPAIAEATYRAMMKAFLDYEQAVFADTVKMAPPGKP
jgi:isochorismate pyruvate lyase